jgi:hypothetical protein
LIENALLCRTLISYLQHLKTYMRDYIAKTKKNKKNIIKTDVLLLEVIQHDEKMFDFLQFNIFKFNEDSPIKIWLRVKCNIDYYCYGKQRRLNLQIKADGKAFVSNINIKEYPYQNKLQEMVILPSPQTNPQIEQHQIDHSPSDPKHNNDESITTPSKKPRIQQELINHSPIAMDTDFRNNHDVSIMSPRKKPRNDEETIRNVPADRIEKIQHSQVTGKG